MGPVSPSGREREKDHGRWSFALLLPPPVSGASFPLVWMGEEVDAHPHPRPRPWLRPSVFTCCLILRLPGGPGAQAQCRSPTRPGRTHLHNHRPLPPREQLRPGPHLRPTGRGQAVQGSGALGLPSLHSQELLPDRHSSSSSLCSTPAAWGQAFPSPSLPASATLAHTGLG